jgi:hypothetical protein
MGWEVASGSEASLTSFGTRHRDVLPRRVSAEGSLASVRGDNKRKGLRATKRGSVRGDKRGSERLDSDFF